MALSAQADSAGLAPSGHKNVVKLVVATSLGNALEWFDISVYAYFAVYLAKAFFPTDDPTTSLLLTFGTFALTFLARPIGGVLLGTYADRYGRKASLLLSIAMMTVGTLAVGCMPTFDKIGVLAPLLVIVARLVQGFSAGGEFGSSTAFLVEHVPGRRGFVASWQFASQGISSLLGSGFRLTVVVDHERSRPAKLGLAHSVPVRSVDRAGRSLHPQQDRGCHRAAGGQARYAGAQGLHDAEVSGAAGGRRDRDRNLRQLSHHLHADLCGQNAAPVADHRLSRCLCRRGCRHHAQSCRGIISDRVGRTPYIIAAGVVLLFAIFPVYLLLSGKPSATVIVLAVLLLGSLKALYLGAAAALMSELFPATTRATGLGLSYNIGVTAFGGSGPAIVTWLGSFALIGDLAPGYYLTAVCLFSLWALITIRMRAADCHGA